MTRQATRLMKTTITINTDEQDSVVAGDDLMIKFFRDVSGDNMSSDANLKEVVLRIPRDYN